eukprot:gnl/MRDRNA2_/MRDRNA2_77049_c0_seq1.p1 gnl/MRDRNA2_/MRDRNA2_77049_c0~~gnl/MRDRNA2_/MRDRNA2_77049_c0_seq1.p1  ORF type:complete len:812 (+),score=143.37 gnl/MRDRNA2_/MRDRNA2_77049_c0_seq1:145-2580(+)
MGVARRTQATHGHGHHGHGHGHHGHGHHPHDHRTSEDQKHINAVRDSITALEHTGFMHSHHDEHGQGSPSSHHGFHGFDKMAATFGNLNQIEHALEDNGGGMRRRTLANAEEYLRDDVLEGGILTKGSRAKLMDNEGQAPQISALAKYDFTEKKWFTIVIALAILLNTIQMGVETDYPDHKPVYIVMENIFTFIFSVEMICKLVFLQVRYFHDSWNVLDFCLVWLSIVDIWIMKMVRSGSDDTKLKRFSMFRIMRIMRTLRFIRLLKVFKELWLILKGMISSVKTIFWASLLLMMLLYVAAIFCVQIIGQSDLYYNSREAAQAGEIDYFPDWDAYQHYGTVTRSMYTLFEISIEPLALRPIFEKQLFMAPFFMIYMFLTTFGVMNVIIGVIVENTQAASQEADSDFHAEEKKQNLKDIEKIRDVCVLLDKDGNGFVTLEELKEGLAQPECSECLKNVELPYGAEESELFMLLDSDGLGHVSHGKLMTNLARSFMHNDLQHMFELNGNLHAAHRLLNNSKSVNDDIIKDFESLEQKYDKQTDHADQIEVLSVEIGKHLQDLVALGGGLPQKPDDCVDKVLKNSRASRDAREEVSPAAPSAACKAKMMMPPIPISPQAPDDAIHQNFKVQNEHGNTTPRSRDNARVFGQWAPSSSSNDVLPSKPKVPLSPRSSQRHALPAIPLGSPFQEPDLDAVSNSQLSTGRRSPFSGSQCSKMSVPPALSTLLTAADLGEVGENGLDLTQTDNMFAFLPAPDSNVPSPEKQSNGRAADHGYQPNVTSLTSLDVPPSARSHKSYHDEWQATEDLLQSIPQR